MEIKIDKAGKHKLVLRKLDEQAPLRRAARVCELLAGFLEVFGDKEDQFMLAAKRASVDLQVLINEYCEKDAEAVEDKSEKPTETKAAEQITEGKENKANDGKKVKV